LTFCVSPEGLERLKRRIQAFRRELIEMVEAEPERNQVVQLNLQLFPLSHAAQPAVPAKANKAHGPGRTRNTASDKELEDD